MSQHPERFDVLIVGESTPDPKNKPKWPTGHTHWNVRIVKVPTGGSVPLEVGKDYALSKEVFNYGSFLGDLVEIEWDGHKYDRAETVQHGFSPSALPTAVEPALQALKDLRASTTSTVPLHEVAGRAKFASYLLDVVFGHTSWRKDYPKDFGTHAQKTEAVQLVAGVFATLTVAKMKAVSKEGGSLAWGAEMILKAAREKSGQMVHEATLALQCGLMCFMPHRRASAAEVDSIALLFKLAAEADKNYGRATADKILDRQLGTGK